jgi:hypothetical protein
MGTEAEKHEAVRPCRRGSNNNGTPLAKMRHLPDSLHIISADQGKRTKDFAK